MARIRLVLLAVIALFGTPAAAAAQGQSLGWSDPVYLSPDGAAGLAPSLGVLGDRTPVALWAQDSGSGFFPVMATKPLTADWTAPAPISGETIDAPADYSFGPRMAVSASGGFVAAWLKSRPQQGLGTVPIIEGAHGTVVAGSPPAATPRVFADADYPSGLSFGYTPRVVMTPDGTGAVAFNYKNCCGSAWLGLVGIAGGAPLGTPAKVQTKLTTAAPSGSNGDDAGGVATFATAGPGPGWLTAANPTLAAVTTSPAYVDQGAPPGSALLRTTTDVSTWPSTPTILPLQGFASNAAVLATGQVLVVSPNGGAP